MNGKVLLGVSVDVVLDDAGALLRYRGEDGEVIATQRIDSHLSHGDVIRIPFYGDVSIDMEESCGCNNG